MTADKNAPTPVPDAALLTIEALVNGFLQHPEIFVTKLPESRIKEIVYATKTLYDQGKQFERRPLGPLPTLLVEGLDAEQIWEQLQLQNAPLLKYADSALKKLLNAQADVNLLPPEELEDKDAAAVENGHASDDDEDEDEAEEAESDGHEEGEEDDDEDAEEVGEDVDDEDEDEEEGSDEEPDRIARAKKSTKSKDGPPDGKGAVEDEFFSLDAMDKFVEDAEEEAAREPKEDDDDDDDEDEVDLERDYNDEEDDEDEDEGGFKDEGGDDDPEEAALKRALARAEAFDDGLEDDEDEEMEDTSKAKAKGKRAREVKFQDFFDPIARQKKRSKVGDGEEDEDEGEDDEDEDDDAEETKDPDALQRRPNESDSAFTKRQAKLRRQIEALEDANVAVKPWQLTGEVSAKQRPLNSLLDTIVEFDHASKPTPVVTQETTEELEEVIKQRIRDSMFDDVVRKMPQDTGRSRAAVELDQEKSAVGLGQIYEDDYKKAAGGTTAGEEQLSKEKQSIDALFKALCQKLDALSNFHFTPKPVVEDLSVKVNVPAIAMEEATPTAVSNAALLAPEEIYDKTRKELKGETELTSEERQRRRAEKKRVRRKDRQQKEADRRLVEKLNPGIGNKYAKDRALRELKTGPPKNVVEGKEVEGGTKRFTQSKAFFADLQRSVTDGQAPRKTKPGADKFASQASFLKL